MNLAYYSPSGLISQAYLGHLLSWYELVTACTLSVPKTDINLFCIIVSVCIHDPQFSGVEGIAMSTGSIFTGRTKCNR